MNTPHQSTVTDHGVSLGDVLGPGHVSAKLSYLPIHCIVRKRSAHISSTQLNLSYGIFVLLVAQRHAMKHDHVMRPLHVTL